MLEWIFFAAFLWLQYEDARTTNIGVDNGGIELNKVIAWLMQRIGKWWVAVKFPAVLLMAYAAISGAWLVLLIANAAYIYVVWNNHQVIDRQKY
jgi:hypothetical protein